MKSSNTVREITGYKKEGFQEIFSLMLPGSKSLTLRTLVLAALANGTSHLKSVADCDDTTELVSALRELGCEIIKDESNANYIVSGTNGKLRKGLVDIQLGLSGTSTRFLIALALLRDDVTLIDGFPPLRERPNKYLIDAIRSLGAEVKPEAATGLPLSITGNASPTKSFVKMAGDKSSQFFSALLQIAPLLPNGLDIQVIGDLVSKPYIDITINQMKLFGVDVSCENKGQDYRVPNQAYKASNVTIEGDASGASYFAALATIHGRTVEFENLGNKTLQGDYEFLKICEQLGSKVIRNGTTTRIIGPSNGMNPISEVIDMEKMPDVAPTLMAIAPLVKNGLRIKGLATLRIKECDRLAVPALHLKKLGVSVVESADSIIIEECKSPITTPILLETFEDHRIAMSFGVLASKWSNIQIKDPECVGKTFPLFWDEMCRFGMSSRLIALG